MRPKKVEYGSVKFSTPTPDPTPFVFSRNSDYRLYAKLKKFLRGRRCTNDEETAEAVEKLLKGVAADV